MKNPIKTQQYLKIIMVSAKDFKLLQRNYIKEKAFYETIFSSV